MKFKFKHKPVAKPEDVNLSKDMYAEAAANKITLSQYLEYINPSQEGDTLDAYERQLKRFGIITRSQPEKGVYASTIAQFLSASQAEHTFEDNQPLQTGVPASTILFPEYISRIARMALLVDQDYDVASLLALTRVIPSSTYKELWIDTKAHNNDQPNADNYEMGRVGEFGTFPRVQIKWEESAQSVVKRGIQIDMSYEFQREASLDILSLVISRIMMTQSKHLFAKALDKVFNGIVATESSTLDANATGGKITYEAWLKWTGGFGVFKPTTYYMTLDTAVKVIMMEKPNVDPVAMMAALKQGPVTQNIKVARGLWQDVTIFPITDGSIPEDYILTFDKRYAIERVVQAGTDLQETERIITQQFESVVISIADEISLIFEDARFLLHLSA